MTTPTVVNYNILNTSNIGDNYSAPRLYYPWLGELTCDVKHPQLQLLNRPAVLGGGGLFYNDMLDTLKQVVLHSPLSILWGCGFNLDHCRSLHYPYWAARAACVGLRDFNNSLGKWVPCPSCKYWAFDTLVERSRYARHPVVLYMHNDSRMPMHWTAPLLDNSASVKLENVIYHLMAGDVVVTDSYHGVYWAQLLGKPVVAWNVRNGRFFNFRHEPGYSDDTDLDKVVACAIAPPSGFLAECRQANDEFAEIVKAELSQFH